MTNDKRIIDYISEERQRIIKKLKKIKKEAQYNDYGWSDLGDDLDDVLNLLKPER